MSRCYFFGCWNEAGHYLKGPHGARVSMAHEIELFGPAQKDGERYHLDGSLAPSRLSSYYGGGLCWAAQQRADIPSHRDIRHMSTECPQGQFLRHVLDNGFTAIQWWDRCQGDARGACNSTVLLEGEHTTEEMLEALRVNFPHVLENLKKNGVELVEVKPG